MTTAALVMSASRRRRESAWRASLMGCAVLTVGVSVAIVASLFRETWAFISQVEVSQLAADGWFPRNGEYGLLTLLVGTVIVTGVALCVAVPLGVGLAMFMAEYARPSTRRRLKAVVEVLAGIPSVVLGFFALIVIAPELIQKLFPASPQGTLLVAGLGVGVLCIPIVASVVDEALCAVPHVLREGSQALGMRKVNTTLKIVLPAAASGVAAALVLAAARAMGETMVVFIAAGGGNGAFFTTDPLDPGLTMTAAMATQASGTDAVVGAGLTFQSLFFVGFVLFAITFAMNLLANRFAHKARMLSGGM